VSAVCRLGAAACALVLSGCSGSPGAAESAEARHRAADADSGFVGVQARGREAMGVDQYTSTHLFEPLLDGGRIELQRDVSDSAGRAQIMAHMARIAAAFATGNFTLPGFVHAREVPGTKVMASEREKISYTVESLPRGAALRLRTTDTAAVEAIHEFLAFQRMDHRAGPYHTQ
jgi:hypothetical protein